MFRRRDRDGRLPVVKCRPTIHPILPVDDLARATDFYERLGFEATAYDEGYAWITHGGWEWVHLRRVESVADNQASAYLHVDDADTWRRSMLASSDGAIELTEATDMPWMKREFSFTDPSSNLIRVGSPL